MDTKDKANERDTRPDQDRTPVPASPATENREGNELSEDDLENIAGGGCMTFVDSAGCSSHGH